MKLDWLWCFERGGGGRAFYNNPPLVDPALIKNNLVFAACRFFSKDGVGSSGGRLLLGLLSVIIRQLSRRIMSMFIQIINLWHGTDCS